MGALSHAFERDGITTVAFGSIREQLVGMAPPRGLFCDFPLGRPLGKPNDAAFQHRVLAHAFDLIERATSQVVETFAEIVHDDGNAALACPVPPRHDPSLPPAVDEARALRPIYDRAVARYGDRGAVGRVINAAGVPDAVAAFLRVAEGTPWKEAGIPGVPARVSQDIRGYYELCALELADHTPAAWEATRWFLRATHAGRTIVAAREAMQAAGEKNQLWFYLVPHGI